jgi:hypothetical protein
MEKPAVGWRIPFPFSSPPESFHLRIQNITSQVILVHEPAAISKKYTTA